MTEGPKAESIRHRLRNEAKKRGEDVQFYHQRYAMERFLYRLGKSPYRERFVLKGATLFAMWGGSKYRPTRDLDFTGYGSSETKDVLAAMRAICAEPDAVGELRFDAETLAAVPIREDSYYDGLRVTLVAWLGEQRIPLQIDIGFGNAIEPRAVDSEFPVLLGDPAPNIRAYPYQAVVAEKFHAMVVLGERNSRMKDFYDLYVLASQFEFDGAVLVRAVTATFERRNLKVTPALPAALTTRFYADAARGGQWRAYLSGKGLPGAPADFAAVGELLLAFLAPIWARLSVGDAVVWKWPAGGPWGRGG